MAERVLITMVHALGSRSSSLTVLGGLVPAILSDGQDPPAPQHLGTTDVDVLLAVHVAETMQGYEALEVALDRAGFEPDPVLAWRWFAKVDAYRLKVEFLCDLDDHPEESVYFPPGCTRLGAVNLRGTRFVGEDFQLQELDGPLIDRDGTVRVTVRMAGLAGYLLAKAHAVANRGLSEDYYDFAYVLLHNASGGPEAAAAAVLAASFTTDIRSLTRIWAEVADRFGTTERIGPRDFARESLLVDGESDEARLREDAVSAVGIFTRDLRVP